MWLVREGQAGEAEQLALDHGVGVIGWSQLGDLSLVESKESLRELVLSCYPEKSARSIGHVTGQIWAFKAEIEEDDLIALPFKTRSAVAIGKVTGPYQWREDLSQDWRHTRPVEWLRDDLPRSAFDADLLSALQAYRTVARVNRDRAEERVRALAERSDEASGDQAAEATAEEEEAPIDLEELARDQIRDYVGRHFRSHDLTRLVAAILEAQGYQVLVSPAGPDGGADIIAGKGPLGFDPPRLCVQVKSSSAPLSVGVFRELQGVLSNFGADRGLLVAWGGFNRATLSEARRSFFEVRLWDAGDLIGELVEHYEQLPQEVQTEVPLKRVLGIALAEAD